MTRQRAPEKTAARDAMTAVGDGPALGVIELTSIARALVVADTGLKRSPAMLHVSRSVSKGRHLLFFIGGVAEVEEAMAAGISAADRFALRTLFLPAAHPQLWPLLPEIVWHAPWPTDAETYGIFEFETTCAVLSAMDRACKAADVQIVDYHLAKGIDGKGYFGLVGPLPEVLAAQVAALTVDDVVAAEVIAHPLAELRSAMFR